MQRCFIADWRSLIQADILLGFAFLFITLHYFIFNMYMSLVKTEKKTVQFSEDVQVETIEPEPEPVYIDEVRLHITYIWLHTHSWIAQLDAGNWTVK